MSFLAYLNCVKNQNKFDLMCFREFFCCSVFVRQRLPAFRDQEFGTSLVEIPGIDNNVVNEVITRTQWIEHHA